MTSVPEIFASNVFNDDVMRDKLPKDVYKSLRKTIEDGEDLDKSVANVVANAMKDWAVEHGATHFTHWFQPLTGITAEKHDSFITPISPSHVIMEFSGKELIKGETDASSFPSGGLRATFEARGYTAWDPTSYAFVKDGSLYIPTVFCSYGGEALDKKTPLLHSMEAINEQSLRILRLFGNNTVKRVVSSAGAEQEYFIVDKESFNKREDLIFCGRTLFGANPPKGQEMDDHYFGTIKPRIAAFMKELDEELWKLGVLSKTKHNEAAPAQHELAPIFSSTNIATDHNQLIMEIMRKVADKHGLVCLLHEKPFAGVNGSGKHNNWSINADTGESLLKAGKTPHENAQFLLFLVAVIKAVDEYQDLLRISVASAGNDHRLGAGEAPPAIVSMFIGDELEAILSAIESGKSYGGAEKQKMEIGVHVLPTFTKDTTDRNRTSPFAFTGNKFEFRMLGSSQSISDPNIVLNTIVAEELRQFADELEKASDFPKALNELIRKTIKAHKRIIYNGNCYSDEWKEEAKKRGLHNYANTVEALPHFVDKQNIELFTSHKVFCEAEMHSRLEILLETYSKTINIEARTFVDMMKKQIIPAICEYSAHLARDIAAKKAVGDFIDSTPETELLTKISSLNKKLYETGKVLEHNVKNVPKDFDALKKAEYFRNEIFEIMQNMREIVDEIEPHVPKTIWPVPTYSELLFNI
ncbi:MAG: glutamine synthetase III [Clostridia bacterium]|nr:glutamine synthetase III [Clostridia bacterium]MBQ8759081.1 glutamine synthetase III [Clostridia bacterium]